MPTYAWIPGHAGVHGNEVADYAAKLGSKSKIHGPEPFITISYACCLFFCKAKFLLQEKKQLTVKNYSEIFRINIFSS